MRVDAFGAGALPDAEIARLLTSAVDLTPAGIIDRFDLRRPIYRRTAAYGHFGANASGLPWEQRDLARLLRQDAACGIPTAG